MELFGEAKESMEMECLESGEKKEISQEAIDKFEKIMGDDKLPEMPAKKEKMDEKFIGITSKEKFDRLFMDHRKSSDFLVEQEVTDSCQFEEHDNLEKKEPNSKCEASDNIHETDDEGRIYKKNGELLPNTEYIINGNKYRTDENGHQISCESIPRYTEEGSRNTKEQKESGGEERREDDDGGHIIAKILGGAEGAENLVPMRRTINRGDYKKMENEISKALQNGKQVDYHIDLTYHENSQRPSKIIGEYMIDERRVVVEFDNNECSIELMDSLGEKISDVDYNKLKEEIEDMAAEDIPSSITSVKMEYAENGNPIKVTVGLLDELSGIKTYKSYEPRGYENEN